MYIVFACKYVRLFCDYSRCFYTIRIRIVLKLVRNIWFAFTLFRNLAPQTSLGRAFGGHLDQNATHGGQVSFGGAKGQHCWCHCKFPIFVFQLASIGIIDVTDNSSPLGWRTRGATTLCTPPGEDRRELAGDDKRSNATKSRRDSGIEAKETAWEMTREALKKQQVTTIETSKRWHERESLRETGGEMKREVLQATNWDHCKKQWDRWQKITMRNSGRDENSDNNTSSGREEPGICLRAREASSCLPRNIVSKRFISKRNKSRCQEKHYNKEQERQRDISKTAKQDP